MFLNKLVTNLVTKKMIQNTYFIYLLQYLRARSCSPMAKTPP